MVKQFLHIFLFFLICFLFTACENDINAVKKFSYYEDIPSEIARDVEMMYSDSMKVRVIVRAPLLERYSGASLVEEFNEGIAVDFIGANLKPTSRLTANKAKKETINIKDEKGRFVREPIVVVQNNVILTSANGDTLKTEELVWFENMGKLESEKFVTIIKPEEIIYGYGFDTDKEFSRWRIRQVTGRFKVDQFKADFQD